MSIKYSVHSSFMNNYHDNSVFSQKGDVATVSDGNGGVLLISIGTGEQIYALSPKSGDLKGWDMVSLTDCLGNDLQAVAISTAIDQNDKPLLCAVMKSKSTNNYSIYFTHIFNASIKKEDWIFRGSKGTTEITNITCGYSNAGKVLIGIITQEGNQTTAYLVNPDTSDPNSLWSKVPLPANSNGVIDFKIGHNAKLEKIDGVDAIAYVLYNTSENESALMMTSMPEFKFYNHLIETSSNPTAFSLIEDDSKNSLLVIGDKDIYLLNNEAQMAKTLAAASSGTKKLNKVSLSTSTKKLILGRVNAIDLQVWAQTQAGDLLQSKSSQGQWDSFYQFEKNVQQIAAWRNSSNGLNDVFYVSLDNALSRYTQDPITTRWINTPLAVPTLGEATEFASYTTYLNITDNDGRGLVGHNVVINCSELTQLKINNMTYYVGQGEHKAVVQTDAIGNILIENAVDSLVTPALRISIDGLNGEFDINPMHDVQNKVAKLSANDIKNAQMKTDEIGKTTPLFKNMSAEDAQHAADSINGIVDVANKLPSNAFPSSQPSKKPVHLMKTTASNSLRSVPQVQHKKLGPVFGIDFTQGKPKFTSNENTINKVHLRNYNQLMSGATSPMMMQSIGDQITHFFGDLWHGIKKGLIAVTHLVVNAIEKGYELVVTILDGTVFKAIVHFAEQAWEVVSHVIKEIGAAIMDALRWLGALFEWKDILRSHDVIKSLINIGFDEGKNALVNTSQQVNTLFAQIRDGIKKSNGITKDGSGIWSQGAKSATANKSGNNPLADSQSNWAITKGTSKSALSNGPSQKSADEKMDDQFMQAVNEIKTSLASAGQNISTSFNNGSVGDVIDSVLAFVEEAVVSAAQLAIQGLLNLAEKIISLVKDILNFRWNIPLITALYEKIIAPGSQLTLLDLVSLIVAIPATVTYKIALKSAPFNDSTVAAIKNCQSFNEVIGVFGSPPNLKTINQQSLSVANESMGVRPAAFVHTPMEGSTRTQKQVATAQANQPSAALKGFDYFLGYTSGVCTIVYGIVNGVAAGTNFPKAGAIKIPTGIIASAAGIISMSIKLGYLDENDPMRSWYNYEMFVTVYQALFCVNDCIAYANQSGPDDLIDVDFIFSFIESILGIFNLIFFSVLVGGDKDALKYVQNLSLSIAQILAGPCSVDKEGVSKTIMAVIIGLTNTGSGVINMVRTGIAQGEGGIHVNN